MVPIRVEAATEHLMTIAWRFLGLIFDEDHVPYEREQTVKNRKTPSTLSTIFGIPVGIATSYGLSKIFCTGIQENGRNTCNFDRVSFR